MLVDIEEEIDGVVDDDSSEVVVSLDEGGIEAGVIAFDDEDCSFNRGGVVDATPEARLLLPSLPINLLWRFLFDGILLIR